MRKLFWLAILSACVLVGCNQEEKSSLHMKFRCVESAKVHAINLESGKICEVTLFPGTEFRVLAVESQDEEKQ